MLDWMSKQFKQADKKSIAEVESDVKLNNFVKEIGEKLGRGLAMLINIFNPELIILGGTLSETDDYLRLPVKSAINKYSLSLVNTDTQLKISKLGEKAGYLGACLLARNKIFSEREISQTSHKKDFN